MFIDIFIFELRYRLKRPATYLYFLVFFLLVFFAIASDSVTIGEQAGNMLRNSPAAIYRITAIISAFGMLVVSAIMSTPVLRDFEHNISPVLFSYPLRKFAYLGGRFLGSYVYALFVFLSIPLGILAGSMLAPAAGWIEASRFDSFRIMPYLWPFLILVIPNTFFSGAIFFSLSSLKRRMAYSYLGSTLLLVFYVWVMSQLSEMDNKTMAAIIDPFGIGTYIVETEYWTPSEINKLLIPFSGNMIFNRLLWLSVGFCLLAFTFFRFKLAAVVEKSGKMGKLSLETEETTNVQVELSSVKKTFSPLNSMKEMFSQGWLEFVNTVKEIPFIGILTAGVLLLISNAVTVNQYYGTSTYPVTYHLLEFTSGNFALIIFIIITFYSGELVWRERGFKMDQIMDSLPLPNWVYSGSKIWAMFLILCFLLIVLFVVNVFTQVFHGFYEFNFPLYFTELFTIQLPMYFGVAILAILVQTFSTNKFVGHVIMMFYYVLFFIAFGMMGVEHYLLKFPQVPASTYSDMNGFGHFLTAVRWYQVAWLFLSVLLYLLITLFWARGFRLSLKNRFTLAFSQFKGMYKWVFFTSLIAFLLVVFLIVYNTTILNRFISEKDSEKMLVDYENQYKKYQNCPQPKIKAVRLNVDIFPTERNVQANGSFLLKNESKSDVDSVHFLLFPDFKLLGCEIGMNSKIVLNDTILGYYIVLLDQAMKPGDSLSLNFKVQHVTSGFVNSKSNTGIVYNGTFLNNMEFLPVIGYQQSNELSDKEKRKKHKLPEKARIAAVNDTSALMHTYLGEIGDWISFEATVSTVPSQIAIAPGYLKREWVEKDRRYFHYKMDRPILNFYSFVSAEFQIAKDKWKDQPLEIYYHKGHEYNTQKMLEAMKASLDYFTTNFSPYQHKQLRIIEFPRYALFAQSFPNTIPFSEGIGFIADLKNEDDIDYVFYVTAHEIAHQWWAHQLIGGNVQGATLMSESLAQYSALMVMEKRYGKDQMRKFLKYELDKYLSGRRGEMEKELPLTLCENQGYIHYHKGSVVMYSLRDYIGEENINKALSMYLTDWAFKAPPFSNSDCFMGYLQKVTPDSLKYLLNDMLETITLYDLRAKEANCLQMEDGRYKLTLTTEIAKFRADSLGNESPLALNDWIEIGVMTEKVVDGKKKPQALYLQKHFITSSNPSFEIIVDEKPDWAGIDPYNKLIDRHSDNNTVKVKF